MFGSSRWSPMGSNSNAGCDESFKHRLSGTGGKHGAPWSETRSVVGQTRRFDLLSVTSDVHSTSDVSGPGRHFAVGPRAVIACMAMGERRDRTWFQHAPTAPAHGSLEAPHDGRF